MQEAKILTRQTAGAARYDLILAAGVIVPRRNGTMGQVGIAVEIPEGYYGILYMRSSLAKFGLELGRRIINSDYRGPIILILINNSNQDITLMQGDRVAQMIISRHISIPMREVQELSKTTQETKGFGLTNQAYIIHQIYKNTVNIDKALEPLQKE